MRKGGPRSVPAVADLGEQIVQLEGLAPSGSILVKCARVEEGLSALTEIVVEFASDDLRLELEEMLGQPAALTLRIEQEDRRRFHGRCVAARFLGADETPDRPFAHYQVTLRPWPWFLTRRSNSRVFQDMGPEAILKSVFDEAGFPDYRFDLSDSYELREYCIQYFETDFDFISRLMEEEGIYYFFDHSGDKEVMVLADAPPNQRLAVEDGAGTVTFEGRHNLLRRPVDRIFDWSSSREATFDAVVYEDYDFAAPTRRLTTQRRAEARSPQVAYGYGVYPPSNDAAKSRRDVEHYAKVDLESRRLARRRWRGVGNVRRLAAGSAFRLRDHPAPELNADYTVVAATCWLKNGVEFDADRFLAPLFRGRPEIAPDIAMDGADNYLCAVEAIPGGAPFRAAQRTPRPKVAGIQTAIVVGPDGRQIHTDKHGRVRIRFHWDPLAPGETAARRSDELTCWTRVMQPWTGRDWGAIAIPRIGQEVAVLFENGDPDRPVIIGMMYNGDTMPPYALPDNMTMSGVKTRSVDGDADAFNEFVMEDKLGAEYVRLQSERDYTMIVKNDATVTIGLEHQDPGDLTQTIHNNKTETLKEGDDALTIEKGGRTVWIKADRTETIKGKSTLTVTGDLTETVEQGNYAHTAAAGKITMEAMQSIELKVAGSSVKIDPSGVTIKGPMIKIEAQGVMQVKGSVVSVEGDAVLILKGGVTLIN